MPRLAPRLPRASWHARARCRACHARFASGLARSRAHAPCVPRMACARSVQCRAFVDGAECCTVQSHGIMLCIVEVRASCGRRRARPQRWRRADEGRRGARGGRARPGRGAWVGRWAAHLACVPTCVQIFSYGRVILSWGVLIRPINSFRSHLHTRPVPVRMWYVL